MTIGSQLLTMWNKQKALCVRPAAVENEIRDFEESNDVKLPADVADYLLHANGFNQTEAYQDENGFNFWPLYKVQRVLTFDDGVFRTPGFDDFFIFADYLDLSWGYALRLQPEIGGNSVAIIGTADGRPQVIADCFGDFARLYMDEDSVLQPK